MPIKNSRIAKLNASAVEKRLAGLQASYRSELDAQAVYEKEELRKQIQDSYGAPERCRITECIPEASEEVKNAIIAVVENAAPAMVDDLPRFAVETRRRREDTRTLLLGMADIFALLADETCKLLGDASEHVEAHLSSRAPALLDLLVRTGELPALMPAAQIGPCLLQHLHTSDDLKADERVRAASCGNNLASWQLGLVKLMLELHTVLSLVVSDMGPVRNGERGAPKNPAKRNAVRKAAAAWDEHLGTWLLTDRPNKPYSQFRRFCEASFGHVVAHWGDDCDFESAVKSVLGWQKPSNYQRKHPIKSRS